MKTLKVRCQVHGREGWFQVHLGHPAPGFHPLHFQAAWLREMRGGVIDPEVMKDTEVLTEEAVRGKESIGR